MPIERMHPLEIDEIFFATGTDFVGSVMVIRDL